MSRLREFALKILLRKEKGIMAVIYATLIVKGKKTLDQVPALIRKQVEEILKEPRSRGRMIAGESGNRLPSFL